MSVRDRLRTTKRNNGGDKDNEGLSRHSDRPVMKVDTFGRFVRERRLRFDSLQLFKECT
jgi:hypothetical protein